MARQRVWSRQQLLEDTWPLPTAPGGGEVGFFGEAINPAPGFHFGTFMRGIFWPRVYVSVDFSAANPPQGDWYLGTDVAFVAWTDAAGGHVPPTTVNGQPEIVCFGMLEKSHLASADQGFTVDTWQFQGPREGFQTKGERRWDGDPAHAIALNMGFAYWTYHGGLNLTIAPDQTVKSAMAYDCLFLTQ